MQTISTVHSTLCPWKFLCIENLKAAYVVCHVCNMQSVLNLTGFGCSWVPLSRQIRVASWKGCLVSKMLQNSSAFDGSPDAEARLQHRQFFPLGCNTRLTLVRGGEGIQGAWFFFSSRLYFSLMSFRYVNMACILELDEWCLYMVKISTAELHDRHVCMYIFVK